MPQVWINGNAMSVESGSTVLQAARKAGVRIPTMCYLEGVQCLGACRVCLVEVEGARTLIASCSTPINEGMKIKTNTRRVRQARRTVVEFLLSEHAGDCQVCQRSQNCELQTLASELGILDRLPFAGDTASLHIDLSTPGLKRDNGKCIKCRRCVSVCKEIQNVGSLFPQGRGFSGVIGPAFGHDLNSVSCVQCGQCSAVCPVGAIVERSDIPQVWEAIEDPGKTVIVQTAPAVRAALGELFGYEHGTLVTGKMTAALRRIGFDIIFDTNFTADLTIMEEGSELLARLKGHLSGEQENHLPMITSCCPGWIKYAEYFHDGLLPNLSTCKSPQQMLGALIKTYYAAKIGKDPKDLFVVSIMPCTAKKFEVQREEMNASGMRDVDVVLTTRELSRMIREANIDFRNLPDEQMDSPMGMSSGAADIFANTGGVMEAALRTVYELVTQRPLPTQNLHVQALAGLEGIKEASLKLENVLPAWSFLEGVTVNTAVAHGLKNAERLLQHVGSGEKQYHFMEIMACPGGCIGGGGQPRFCTNEVRASRIASIYREDEGKQLRKSHDNPYITRLYEEFLGKPLGEKSHHLLHTHYTKRSRV